MGRIGEGISLALQAYTEVEPYLDSNVMSSTPDRLWSADSWLYAAYEIIMECQNTKFFSN